MNKSETSAIVRVASVIRPIQTVLTNGCFDILHAGHVDLLWKARALGDYLIVAVNSDESVRKLKGENRPINNIANRIFVLRSMKMVDEVVVFNETTVTRIIREIAPALWVKGGDYTLESLDKEEVASANQVEARIIIVPVTKAISTTSIIKAI